MRAQNPWTWTWIFLALSDLLIGAIARTCVFDHPGYRSEDELHRAFDGCTTIVADNITIGDLRDSLVVSGVKNITGTLLVPNNDEWGMPVLGSIAFPDLEYLGGLYVYEVNELQNYTFPRLREVREMIDITGIESESRFDFGSLHHAGAVRIWGSHGIADLDLHSLQAVDNDLIIKGCEGCGEDPPSLGLSGLVSAGYISISNHIDSVSLPNLASIGHPLNPGNANLSTDSGARFNFSETKHSFDFNLTKLESLDKQLSVIGNIRSLNLDALKTTNASIYIDAGRPLPVNLPLESAGSIDLEGRIISVHLPNLSPDTNITLNSDYNCDEHGSLTEVSCHMPSHLSRAAKVGIGIGVGLGVALIILGIFFCCKRVRKNRAERRRQRNELADLPAYGAAAPGAVDSSTALRPRSPPPPYSAGGNT
ncbi:hypothetical protein BJY01DRAFT_230073 [Aspergillus pseudoustus]|uniref:Receptor L-domain domain-containing protein n=1 Tax=Aspergillus pseudoustus TaxID=1810923 RepID=A0ABR4IFP0_9EURO